MRYLTLMLFAVLVMAGAGRADTVTTGGKAVTCKVEGLREGKLLLRAGGGERLLDLAAVEAIGLDDAPKLLEAETIRNSDPKAAAALYKQVIPTINNAELKRLAELRAIAPTDSDGRWVEAVNLFLEVYLADPAEGIWKARPTHLPNAGSSLLKDSAERVTAAINAAGSDEARKNLRSFLLDIYNRAGDTASAARLAREIATGTGEEGGARSPASQAAGAGPASEVDAAVRAFQAQASACEAANKLDDAVAALLRMAVHYPSSPAAPGALLHAAELQEKLNRSAAAGRLRREILERYPDSPEAVKAKGQ